MCDPEASASAVTVETQIVARVSTILQSDSTHNLGTVADPWPKLAIRGTPTRREAKFSKAKKLRDRVRTAPAIITRRSSSEDHDFPSIDTCQCQGAGQTQSRQRSSRLRSKSGSSVDSAACFRRRRWCVLNAESSVAIYVSLQRADGGCLGTDRVGCDSLSLGSSTFESGSIDATSL